MKMTVKLHLGPKKKKKPTDVKSVYFLPLLQMGEQYLEDLDMWFQTKS